MRYECKQNGGQAQPKLKNVRKKKLKLTVCYCCCCFYVFVFGYAFSYAAKRCILGYGAWARRCQTGSSTKRRMRYISVCVSLSLCFDAKVYAKQTRGQTHTQGNKVSVCVCVCACATPSIGVARVAKFLVCKSKSRKSIAIMANLLFISVCPIDTLQPARWQLFPHFT